MQHESITPRGRQRAQPHDEDAHQALRQHVSALMDDDLPPAADLDEVFAELARDPEARDAWLDYHRIGDALRAPGPVATHDERAFLNRFHERLAAEPVQLAPRAAEERRSLRRISTWVGAMAAAVAGVATVAALHGVPGGPSLPGWSDGDAGGAQPRVATQPLAQPPAGSGADGMAAAVLPPQQLAAVPPVGGPAGAVPAAHDLDTQVSVPRALLAHLTCSPPLHRHDPARLQWLR